MCSDRVGGGSGSFPVRPEASSGSSNADSAEFSQSARSRSASSAPARSLRGSDQSVSSSNVRNESILARNADYSQRADKHAGLAEIHLTKVTSLGFKKDSSLEKAQARLGDARAQFSSVTSAATKKEAAKHAWTGVTKFLKAGLHVAQAGMHVTNAQLTKAQARNAETKTATYRLAAETSRNKHDARAAIYDQKSDKHHLNAKGARGLKSLQHNAQAAIYSSKSSRSAERGKNKEAGFDNDVMRGESFNNSNIQIDRNDPDRENFILN